MPVSSFFNNSIVTAELVRTLWKSYISRYPTFLNAVTLEIQTLDSPGSAGILEFIVPNYFGISSQATLNNHFPDAYSLLDSYESCFQKVEWNANNVRVIPYKIGQFDQTLLMTKEEYRKNFIEGALIKLLLDFEQDFAAALQGYVFTPKVLNFAGPFILWPTILATFPKTDWDANNTGVPFESKASFWYASNIDPILSTTYSIPGLGFIPSISELGGWAVETCSIYAKYLNLKNPQLACTPAVLEGICSEYAIASSTSSLINKWNYNIGNNGNSISNGLLNIYTLPSLGVFYDSLGWSQGIMFKIISSTTDVANQTITLTLECITKNVNLPVDNNLNISIYTPLTLGCKRYTPAADIANYSGIISYDYDFGQSATFNLYNEYIINDGSLFTGSHIVVTVRAEQLATPFDKFPVVNVSDLFDVVVALPWKSRDFNTVCTVDNFQCTHTGPLTLHANYLYSKDATYAFAVKQRAIKGGAISTEEEIKDQQGKIEKEDKVPFMIFERGSALGGTNNITMQGIMTFGIIPQLGGQFLCWSAYPSDLTF